MTAKHVGGLDFYVNGAWHTGVARYDNPTSDISLVKVNEALGGWYTPYYGDVLGQTLTYVGFGATGVLRGANDANPFTGYHDIGNGGIKRKMTNVAGAYGTVTYDGWTPGAWTTSCIVADLDTHLTATPPANQVDTLGDGGPTAEEGGLLYGDSGSGALLKVNGEWRLVGINISVDDANGPNPGGWDNYMDFGDVFESTRVASYEGWIKETMNPVPEPPVWMALSSGMLMGLGALKRRRR